MNRKQLQLQIATLMAGAMTGDSTEDTLLSYDIACALLHRAVELAQLATKKQLGRAPSFEMIALALTTDAYRRLTTTRLPRHRKGEPGRRAPRKPPIRRPKLRLVK
jgi:hypothetical protein